jgi:branched-chain amino acid transport system substrate-binding protein
MKTRSRVRWTAVAVAGLTAATMALSAGSSSSKTNSATSSPAGGSSATSPGASAGSSSPAATGSPLTIGYVCDCTGPDASSVNAITPVFEAWAAWENQNGGIAGHPVKMIKVDDGQNSGTSLTQVTKLINDNHVIAIFDNSDVDAAWAKTAQDAGVPVVGGNLASDLFLTNPDFFPQGGTGDSVPFGILGAAKKVNADKLSVLYCSNVPICAQLPPALKQLGAPEGVQVTYSAALPNSAPNYTAQCVASKQSGANSVFVASATSVTLGVARSCAAQGYKPTYIASETSLTNSSLGTPGIDGAVGELTNLAAVDTAVPAIATMQAALNKYDSGYMKSDDFGPGITMGWAAGMLFDAAARAANLGASPTAADILTGLYSLKDETLGGLSSPLNYVKGKSASVKCWFYYGIKGSQFTAPYGSQPTCAGS